VEHILNSVELLSLIQFSRIFSLLITCKATCRLKFGEQLVFKKLENSVLERAPAFGMLLTFFSVFCYI